jgi:hypothetical protein
MSKSKQDTEAIHASVGRPPTKKPPAVLYFDIETTGIILLGWRLGKTNLSIDQIIKNPQVFCISWAWNDGKIQHAQFDQNKYQILKKDDDADYELLKNFVEMARDADVIVGHNGKNFDIAFLRSRLIKHRLPDFAPMLIDDTYLSTKGIDTVSHKLDYLGDYLDVGKKMEHGHGAEWWVELARGNKQILKKFLKYCDIDVDRLRKIYKILKPYTGSSLNLAVFYERPDICPTCGSTRTPIIRHYKYTRVGKFPQFQCHDCGKYFPTGKNLIKKPGTYPR